MYAPAISTGQKLARFHRYASFPSFGEMAGHSLHTIKGLTALGVAAKVAD
jgi:hypothetical protein